MRLSYFLYLWVCCTASAQSLDLRFEAPAAGAYLRAYQVPFVVSVSDPAASLYFGDDLIGSGASSYTFKHTYPDGAYTVNASLRRGEQRAETSLSFVMDNLGPLAVLHAPQYVARGSAFTLDWSVTDSLTPVVATSVRINGLEVATSASGALSYTVPPAYRGDTLGLFVQGTDAAGNVGYAVTKNIIVSGTPSNQPPTITSTPPLSVVEGQTYSYPASAEDPDGDPLTWSLLQAPDGLTLDPTTGLLSWTPPLNLDLPDMANTSGLDPPAVTTRKAVADVLVLSSTLAAGVNSVEIQELNALGLTYELATPDQWRAKTAEDFASYRLLLLADSNSRQISLISAAVETASVWAPVVDGHVFLVGTDPSQHLPHGRTLIHNGLRFTTNNPQTTSFYFSLAEYYRDLPVTTPISFLDVFAPHGFAGGEKPCYDTVQVVAAHPTLADLSDDLLSNWTCSTHTLFSKWPDSFTVLGNALAPAGPFVGPTGQAGYPYLLVRSPDLRLRSSVDIFPYQSQALVGSPYSLQIQTFADRFVAADLAVQVEVVAGPNLGQRHTLRTNPQGLASFSYTSTSPGLDQLVATTVDRHGNTHTTSPVSVFWRNSSTHTVSLRISDPALASDTQTFALTVQPRLGTAAPFAPLPPQHLALGNTLTLSTAIPTASAGTRYELYRGPAGARIDPNSGLLTWTPTWTSATQNQLGHFPLLFAAHQDHGSSFIATSVTVTNQAPVVHPPAPIDVFEAITFRLPTGPLATDPDGYPLKVRILNNIGTLSGSDYVWRPSARDAGTTAAVLLEFSDPYGATTTLTLTLRVQPNHPPQFTSSPQLFVRPGSTWTYAVTAHDTDNDPLSLSRIRYPIGLRLSGMNLTWAPATNQLGPFLVQLELRDSRGGLAVQEFTLQVASNARPVFASAPVTLAELGAPYLYSVAVSDPDGSLSSLSLLQAPPQLQLQGNNLSGSFSAAGLYPVTLRATDNEGLSTEQSFELRVRPPNQNPVPLTNHLPDAIVAVPYSASLAASDPDNDPLTFQLDQTPQGLTLNANHLSWTPAAPQQGSHPLQWTVRDDRGGSASQQLTLRVAPNQPPSITSVPTTQTRIEQPYTYALIASDPENQTLVYQLLTGPTGLLLADNQLQWTPTHHQIGSFPVAWSVADPAGNTVTQGFNLHVLESPNQPPVISSIPSTLDLSVAMPWEYLVDAQDPDGDHVHLSLDQSPDGLTLLDNRLSWTPSATGSFPVTLRAADHQGLSVTQSFVLVVRQNNQPPVLQPTEPTSAIVAVPYSATLNASDPDNDPLRFQLDQHPDGLTLTNQQLQWTPNAQQLGQNTVTWSAHDPHGASGHQSFTLTVAPNQPPSITSNPNLTAVVEQSYTYPLTVSDPEHQTLTFALLSGPSGLILHNQQLQWTPDAQQVGTVPVSWSVSDPAGNAVTQSFELRVRSNEPPVFTSPVPSQPLVLHQPWTHPLDVQEPNGGTVSLSLDQAPLGMRLENNTLSWTPDLTGSFTVTLSATGPYGASTSQTFQLQVNPAVNHPPVFTSSPTLLLSRGSLWTYHAIAQDPDPADVVSFHLEQTPDGLDLSPLGSLTWRPTQLGTFPVSLVATDSHGASATQTFVLSVVFRTNTTPHITSTPIRSADAGRPYSYQVTVEDPDGYPLFYQLVSAPQGLTIDPTRGLISWNPSRQNIGSHNVTVLVSDVAWASTTQSYSLTVRDPGDIEPPDVHLNVPKLYYQPGETVDLQIVSRDNVAVNQRQIRINDTELTLDAQGRASFLPTAPGLYDASASAQDAAGNSNRHDLTLYVGDPSDTDGPQVVIHSPGQRSRHSAPSPVVVTAYDPNLASWTLEVGKPDQNCWTKLASGDQPLQHQTAALLDPSRLSNGLYLLRLSAWDLNGVGYSVETSLVIEGQLKVGRFEVAFTDLDVPLRGIPAQLNRIYDSTQLCPGEFGYGWSRANADLQASITLGRLHQLEETSYCVSPTGSVTYPPYAVCHGVERALYCLQDSIVPHYVTVTLPGGDVHQFDLELKSFEGQLGYQSCRREMPPEQVEAQFLPRERTTSSLQILGNSTILFRKVFNEQTQAEEFMALNSDGDPWNPSLFQLTTDQGIVFTLHQTHGIQSITDREGNSLTYDRSGIHHSDGTAISYQRDSQGRITRATDPEGLSVTYTYDAVGDLVAVTNRNQQTTTYQYDAHHQLIAITTPDGRTPTKMFYDADGRLIAQEDANGQRITYEHDLDGRQERIRDRNGNLTVSTYDDWGNILQTTDPLGQTTAYTYDTHHNETSKTIAVGTPYEATTRRTYDAKGNVLTETDAEGNTTHTTYDAHQNPLSITDPLGQTTTFQYDNNGLLTSWTNPLGSTTAWAKTFNDASVTVTQTSPSGLNTLKRFTLLGKPVLETDALSHSTRYRYRRTGDLLEETSSAVIDGQTVTRTTSWAYDAGQRLIRETRPDGSVFSYEYDAANNRSAQTDPLGNRTTYRHDAFGNLIETQFPDGTSERRTYDLQGNLATLTDREGRITSFQYDPLNRLTRTHHPDGTSEQREYDPAGRLSASINAKGFRTEYFYDQLNQLTEIHDPLGYITRYQYDANGNQTAVTDAVGHTTQYVFDAANRPTRILFADGSVSETQFDIENRPIRQTDQVGQTTHFQYDANNQLTQVTDALGNLTHYRYDPWGNLSQAIDALGRSTVWTYDQLDRPLRHTLPLGMSANYAYDAAGNLERYTDFAGQSQSFVYDANGRLTRKTFANGQTVEISYRSTGVVETVRDARGLTSYVYDLRDRLAQLTLPSGAWIRYGYDPNGNRTQLQTTNQALSFEYDARDQVNLLRDKSGQSTAFTYTPVGRRETQLQPNGVVTEYAYNARHHLIQQVSTAPDGTVLDGFTLQVAADGTRLRAEEASGRSRAWTYDAGRRLLSETIQDPLFGNSQTSWTYDAVGNRLSQTRDGFQRLARYDANDQLLQDGDTSFTYDPNGNRLSEDNGQRSRVYDWDASNQLIGYQDGLGSISYQYDANGQLVQTQQDGQTVQLLVDPNRTHAEVIEEHDEAGMLQSSYLHDETLLQVENGPTRYALSDFQGSVIGLADSEGTRINQIRYEAWGERQQASPMAQPYGYTGERQDPRTGLIYLRSRHLDPQTGRFLSRDTWPGLPTRPISQHKYLYTENNPATGTDPTGQMTLTELMTTLRTNMQMEMPAANNFRVIFKETGCIMVEYMVEEAIGHGIYIFMDGNITPKKPYVGKTINSFEERARQHASAKTKRIAEWFVAKFHLPNASKDQFQLLEQWVFNKLIGELGDKGLSNSINPLSEKRPKKKGLNDILSNMDLCD